MCFFYPHRYVFIWVYASEKTHPFLHQFPGLKVKVVHKNDVHSGKFTDCLLLYSYLEDCFDFIVMFRRTEVPLPPLKLLSYLIKIAFNEWSANITLYQAIGYFGCSGPGGTDLCLMASRIRLPNWWTVNGCLITTWSVKPVSELCSWGKSCQSLDVIK